MRKRNIVLREGQRTPGWGRAVRESMRENANILDLMEDHFRRREPEDSLRRKPLLAIRVPRAEVIPGRAYLLHARYGGVGIAVRDEEDLLAYRVRQSRRLNPCLRVETDWDEHPIRGSAIPLRLLPDEPPADRDLLGWLARQNELRAGEIRHAWRQTLGDDGELGVL